MRLRKVKNALDKLKESPYFIFDGKDYKGKWGNVFSNDRAIHIEIGCGKGQFILKLAEQNPDINYIAIEKYDSVLLRVKEKLDKNPQDNVRLVLFNAVEIESYFESGEVARIYLNFSDPWPKNCHEKRRLTSSKYLEQYENILKEGGKVFQKTDNRKFFEYSLQSWNNNGWHLERISLDLHKDTELYPDNITTEFEDKWSEVGPIYRLEAYKK